MLDKKKIMIFTVLFSTLMIEFIVIYPNFLYPGIALVNILFFLVFHKFSKDVIFNKNSLVFLISPILFTDSLIIFLSIASNTFFIQFLIFINFLFIYYYTKQYYRMDVLKIENIKWVSFSSYISFLIIFFLSSSVYGLNSLLSFPVWSLIFFIIGTTFLVTYQSFFFNSIKKEYFITFILIICFILTEIAWVLFFLPFNYYVLGLILAICYYVIIGVTKLFLKDSVNKKKIKFFLIFGISSILLIILTTKIL